MQEMFSPESMDFDLDIWYKTKDPNFLDLSRKSQAKPRWLSYQRVFQSSFGNKVIQPINWYAANISQRPNLVDISGSTVTLRQNTHADIYLLVQEDGKFYNVDRPWIRQYYNTALEFDIPDNCFQEIYKFYAPWFVNSNVEVKYSNCAVDSAFNIYPVSEFSKVASHDILDTVDPHMIPFSFKNIGSHMEDNELGIIRSGSPVFDMSFELDDIQIKQLLEMYEK